MSITQPTNENEKPTTPSINYAPIIQGAKDALKSMENDRLSAEKDKEHAEKRLEEHYAEVKNLGVEPERLEEKITELDVELFEDMVATVELIPADYRKRFIDRAVFEAAVKVMEESIGGLPPALYDRARATVGIADMILNPPPAEELTSPGEVD